MTKARGDLPEMYGDLFTYAKDMHPNFTLYPEQNAGLDPALFFPAGMIV